jgi:hypothetical protein
MPGINERSNGSGTPGRFSFYDIIPCVKIRYLSNKAIGSVERRWVLKTKKIPPTAGSF